MNEKIFATQWRQASPMPSGVVCKSRRLLRNVILSTLALLSRPSEDAFLRCLHCHNVFDDQQSDFEKLILNLKKFGKFIDTDTCIKMLKGEKELDGKYFHLSFDDGFRNNYTNALPVLMKHGVPSIFFVPSSLIGASWEEAKVYCLQTTRYNAVIEMLEWEDLKRMISLGYDIGSHTKTHASFSDMSHNPLLIEDEIIGSKNEIEIALGIECKYISWPYGRIDHVDELSLNIVKQAGYLACFGGFRGTVIPEITDIFKIPRHHFEVYWPLSHIEYFVKEGHMEVVL